MSDRRGFGAIRKLPSGRYQASYTGPDRVRHTAPQTFLTKAAADGWLSTQHADIIREKWSPAPPPEQAPAVTLGDYANAWLSGRELSPSTRRLYRITLDKHILPSLRKTHLTAITPVTVRQWHGALKTGPTQRAQAYSLLRTICNTAVADDVITANPCRIRGAASTPRVRPIRPASLEELSAIAGAMPERYKVMVLLAAWCAMRFGELAELRRSDVDTEAGIVHVRRGIVDAEGGRVVKDPKSAAGRRDVHIPPHLIPAVEDHLDAMPAGPNALLFPGLRGRHLAHSQLYSMFYPAREKAGRPDLRFHDLRHTGAVLAAATGATLAELMARLGHSTVGAAMRYQHASQDRDKVIAEALSKMATVTPITAARSATG